MLDRSSRAHFVETGLVGFVAILLMLCLPGCGGGGASSQNNISVPPPPTVSGPKTVGLFGLHIQSLQTPVPTIGFGEARIWSNVSAARWANINTSSGVYDFSILDGFLGEFFINGVDDVVYTIGQVPQWASSNPGDTTCSFATTDGTFGGCDLPPDINNFPDGSGGDATYVAFVTAIAQHVNDPTYLQSHSHIKYWEPWNEWYRNSVINPTYVWPHYSINATYAQMVRMTEDLRCTITGTGSVNGVPCTSPAIDPTALIVSPSDGSTPSGSPGSAMAFANFLSCNNSLAPPQTSCTTGSRGSAAVDVINTHFYETQPETLAADVPTYMSLLSPTDDAKPFWSDEGSWGDDTALPDPDVEASWVSRYYLVGWSSGLARMYWYAYDTQFGTLWTAAGLDPAGQAYGVTFNWIAGASLTTPCANSAGTTLWICSLTLKNGNSAQIVWDPSMSCSGGSCPTNAQSVATTFGNYQDLTGTNNPISTPGTVQVGLKPILLTATAAAAP